MDHALWQETALDRGTWRQAVERSVMIADKKLIKLAAERRAVSPDTSRIGREKL